MRKSICKLRIAEDGRERHWDRTDYGPHLLSRFIAGDLHCDCWFHCHCNSNKVMLSSQEQDHQRRSKRGGQDEG